MASWSHKVLEKNRHGVHEGKCIMCQINTAVEAHHIVPKADYPELRNDVKNGAALCQPCHEGIHRTGTECKVFEHLSLVKESVAPGTTVKAYLETLIGRIHLNRRLQEETTRNRFAPLRRVSR